MTVCAFTRTWQQAGKSLGLRAHYGGRQGFLLRSVDLPQNMLLCAICLLAFSMYDNLFR